MSSYMPLTPQRLTRDGVTLATDRNAAGTGVTFCFSERTGGVSPAPYASLNMGGNTQDDPRNVRENRRRLLAALDAQDLLDRIVRPGQVHGDAIAVLDDEGVAVPDWVRTACDGVVCTIPDTPVMCVYADCVPIVMVAPGGFAVVHSGWRGTRAEIGAKAARLLAEHAGCDCGQIAAYIGPHIGPEAYEVSQDMCDDFASWFGPEVVHPGRRLDLAGAIAVSLQRAGVPRSRIVDMHECTYENVDRYFSHRAESGLTGRHCALAFMRPGAAVNMRKDG